MTRMVASNNALATSERGRSAQLAGIIKLAEIKEYDGKGDVNSFLFQVEDVYSFFPNLSDEQRIVSASIRLNGLAQAWYHSARADTTLTWESFKSGLKIPIANITDTDKCQRNKATNQLPPGLLQPLFLPSRNWQQVSMDFIGPLPATPRGHTMIFTIVDKLSKMIHLIPTTTTATAHDTARLFFDHIIKHHGLPEAIIWDRDSKFTSDFWTSLFHHTGTRLLLSSAYHPQTDGQIEQANRTVEDMLWPYVNDHKADWDQHLAAVEFAYNSSEHAGPAFTPFYLNYDQHPTTPSALLLPPPTLVPNQAAEDFNAVKSAKLQPRFVGPLKVLAKHSPVSFKLDLPSSMHILPTFHIRRVRPYLSSSSFP
ncbi:hypothetical protein QJQ45_002424 [Haematococcus lacustris]|nr:hypothetical protein QJQ45_002424 [Haematococcus lacustris]